MLVPGLLTVLALYLAGAVCYAAWLDRGAEDHPATVSGTFLKAAWWPWHLIRSAVGSGDIETYNRAAARARGHQAAVAAVVDAMSAPAPVTALEDALTSAAAAGDPYASTSADFISGFNRVADAARELLATGVDTSLVLEHLPPPPPVPTPGGVSR